MNELTDEDIEQSLNADLRYQALTGPSRVAKRKEVYEKLGRTPPVSIANPGTKEFDPDGPVHTFVRPVLEGAGMLGGGLIGAPVAPPYGAVGGAIGGYMLGDTASSFLERLAGERPPISSPAEAIMEPVRSFEKGATVELLGRGMGRLLGKGTDLLTNPFRQQYEGANKTLDEVAQSRGIQLDPHEILQNRPLALGHKVLENIPFTAGLIQRQEMKKLEGLVTEWERLQNVTGTRNRGRIGEIGQKIQDTIDRELSQVEGLQGNRLAVARDQVLQQVGSQRTYKELGEATQQAIRDRLQGLKDIENLAWEHAREAVPDARVLTPTLKKEGQTIAKEYENLPSFLDEPLLQQLGNVQSSGNRAYDREVARILESIPEGLGKGARTQLETQLRSTITAKPGWRFDDLLRLRSALSESISQHHSGIQRGDIKAGSADAYARVYTRLLKAIDADIEAFGNAQGSDIAQRFKLARQASGERLQLLDPKNNPAVVKAIDADAPKIAQTLIKPGNAAGYTELRQAVGPQAIGPVKKAFTNTLLDVGGKEGEGLAGLRKKLDGYGRQTLAEIYNPSELRHLYQLADKASWAQKSPVGNPFFRQLVREAPSRVAPSILESPEGTAKILRSLPQLRQPLREAFVEGLKPKQESLYPTTLLKQLNAYPPAVQRQLFSQQELREFTQLAQIADRAKKTVAMADNPSGTAQGVVAFTAFGAAVRHPLRSTPSILGGRTIAKLYLSPLGRKYLLEGLTTPHNSFQSVEIATKLLGIAGIDVAEEQARARKMTQ